MMVLLLSVIEILFLGHEFKSENVLSKIVVGGRRKKERIVVGGANFKHSLYADLHVWCQYVFVVPRHVVPAQVVGQYEDNVGRPGGGGADQ